MALLKDELEMRDYNSLILAQRMATGNRVFNLKFLFWKLLIGLNGGWLNYIRTTLRSLRRESDLIGFNLKHSL